MKTVKIKKEILKAKLIENLEKHDKVYDEALENYWEDIDITFKEKIKDAQEIINERDISNGAVNVNIYLATPVSYKESYEDALAMLEYEIEDEIELTQDEFKSYVLNQWSWSNQFLASNAMYASEGSMVNFSTTM